MLALDHIKVLDVSRGYPPSYSAMFMGDFGAQVIRVDSPLPTVERPGAQNPERQAAFNPWNRNKKSIILNLKTPEAQRVLHQLAKRADVLIENNRPGVMKRLNCDYDTLKEVNHRLIYCSCSGFGQDGPYMGMVAHDMNYIAIAGALSLVGPRDGPPCFPSNYLADMAGCGLHAVIGILTAIIAREKTGYGQLIDMSYTDGVLSLMMAEVAGYFLNGQVPKRGETRLTGGALWAQVYKCRDGEYFTIACAEKHLWDNFCRSIGREDLMEKHQATGEEKDRFVAELGQIFITRTRDEWSEFFKDKEVCAGPVNYLNEALKDPQILHRNMLLEFDHPAVGKVQQLGIPIKLSDTPGSVRSLGTPIGSHTEEILAELGYSQDDIKRLRKQAALG